MSHNSKQELAIAHEVRAQHNRFWFGIARQVANTVAIYAILAGILRFIQWTHDLGNKTGRIPSAALTLKPEVGAAILAILASVVIALNVLVWATRSAEVSEVVAYTRTRYLSLCGVSTGTLAILTGLATVFDGAPGQTNLAALLLLGSAVFLAVLGNDTGLLLGKDIPVQRRVPEVEREDSIRALAVVAGRWRDPQRTVPKQLNVWTVIDLVTIAIIAALPIVVLSAYGNSVDGRSVAWVSDLARAAGAALFSAILAIYTLYVTARNFVARRFAYATMTSLFGGLAYVTIALALVTAAIGPDGRLSVAVVLAVAFLVPIALIATHIIAGTRCRLPGWTVRDNMHRSIVREIAVLRRRREQAPHTTPPPRVLIRAREWSDRVTGMSTFRSTIGHARADATPG
ncbi:hypothetical protein [Rhodococcus maanshanensis]|uniref:Uncharacterized protein n=1 Tax=Rhodococcus maanshanensis TaxID=183556 RepID=A0A1H7SF08_9NOCA|nr:hypothetical protein [Rhodococcus maanshanensis]SEL70107.1 hypothetical protein SAMN05444583_11327 [Rhodococcus maanshanensis]